MNGLFKFERGVWYTFDYLEENLQGVSLKQFLSVLKLDCTGRNRLFQNGIFGDEILDAVETLHGQGRQAAVQDAVPVDTYPPITSPRKRGRPRKQAAKVQDFR